MIFEGEVIVLPPIPLMDGYEFVGWTPVVPDTMPAYDLFFDAVIERIYVCPNCGEEIIG